MTLQQAMELAISHHQARRLPDAEKLYRQVLAQDPRHSDALHRLGAIAYEMQRFDVAGQLVSRAIQIDASVATYHNTLGLVESSRGQFDQAIRAFEQAIQLRPAMPDFCNNLVMACVNSGVARVMQDDLEQAIPLYRKAIAINPQSVEAHYNLGNAMRRMWDFDGAAEAYRAVLALRPDHVDALINLGNLLKETGELDEAMELFRRAMQCAPNDPAPHSNLLLTMHFHPGSDARAIYQEHLNWRRQHADPLRARVKPHANDRDPARRLRIGYISPDFHEHSVARFMLPILGNHDLNVVETYCYSDTVKPDAFTYRLRAISHVWREICGMTDEQIAGLVRQDQIDILIDLSLHSAGHRLLVFARKPAPVQVTYLGYCSTSGLDTIDYRISDLYLDPPEANNECFSEKTIHLPRTYWCYQPEADAPQVTPLPAQSARRTTFGCLNDLGKVTQPTLNLWGDLLRAVPGSQLLIYAPQGKHRQRIGAQIDPDRVQFVAHLPLQKYLATYNQIDIGLDPFPFNGGTTTCDALWMGVPVVSLVGTRPVSRAGLSILSNVGLPELVARSEDDYVKFAIELANDLPRLSELRSSLRQRMLASPLTDARQFARDIEAAYRQMWQAWCAS